MSWRHAWFIGRKDFRYAIRSKEAIVWIFLTPILFFYFIGTVTGGAELMGDAEAKRPLAVHVGSSPGFLVGELEGRLDENGFEVIVVETEEALAEHELRLRLPEAFTERVLAGEETPLFVQRREQDVTSQLDEVRLGRAIYTLLADIVVAAEADGAPTPESFERLHATTRALTLRVQPAGERRSVPTGFDQSVPGILVMFTMIVLLTSGSAGLVVERQTGVLRRLASAPISRGEIVLGKWLGRLGVAIVQIAVALLFGSVVFRMDWGPDVGMVGVVLLGWAAFCASLGLLLGVLARTEGQAVGLGILFACVLAALGGCWWPTEVTSPGMQALARWLPTGWAMDAMHQLINYRAGPASAVGSLLLLLAAAVAVGWVAARRFRYE